MIYLDAGAVVALTVRGTRGRALARWLNHDPGRVVLTSVLTEVQATAELRCHHPERLVDLPHVLAGTSRYALDAPVRHLAGILAGHPGGPPLPWPAAVHVATALVVLGPHAAAFVTDDPATARAATARHLPVLGRPPGTPAPPAPHGPRRGAPGTG